MIIGFGFNLIIKAYKNTENLSNIIEEQNQTLVQYAKQIESLTLVEERNGWHVICTIRLDIRLFPIF